jgi:NAD(P)-dependent dehydrogenase (short-subunit alcohol dehydrogenase family)
MEIDGRSWLVTGAGSGLGRATAEALAAAGGTVICVDLDADRAEETAYAVGGASLAVSADVTSESEMTGAVAAAGPTLAGCVNCAGIAIAARVVGRSGPHPLEQFVRVISVNLIGTFNVTRLVAAALADGEPDADGARGVIVNTASIAAFDGQVGQAAYAASKGGVAALTLPIARELASNGIRCVTIAPGIFETSMLDGLPDDARASLGAQVPFPTRLGRPSEFAALVVHAIRNPMLNGEVVRLDGALRMAPR